MVTESPDTTASVNKRRSAMPEVAQIVDWMRQHYGAEFVDQQMATAQQARREYAQVLDTQGPVAAKRWHVANAHRCTFVAQEGGRTVGMAHPFSNNL